MPSGKSNMPAGAGKKPKGVHSEEKRLTYVNEPEQMFPVSDVVKPSKGMIPRDELRLQPEQDPGEWLASGSKGREPPKKPSKQGSGSSTGSDSRYQKGQPSLSKPVRTGTNDSLRSANGGDKGAVKYRNLHDASREVSKLRDLAEKLSKPPSTAWNVSIRMS